MDILRKANRISVAAKRLRSCLADTAEDFGKAAAVASELGSLYRDPELQGVKFVELDLKFVQESVESLPERIVNSLSDSVNTQDLVKIGVAMDACLVFENLNEVLAGVSSKFLKNVQVCCHEWSSWKTFSQREGLFISSNFRLIDWLNDRMAGPKLHIRLIDWLIWIICEIFKYIVAL